ncbi:MAG TPA: hypothetical protein VGC30_14075 [Dokdonella sp.]
MNVKTARMTTNVLAGVCGALLLLAVAQYAGVGRGYHWQSDAEGDPAAAPLAQIDKQTVTLPPLSAFADIEAHPLFNEDREPTPIDAEEAADAGPPPSPLNVTLTGVLLDEKNHVRVAMLQDKARNQAIALKVGMPLEGDQSNWTLVDVKPRGVVFKSATNETTEIALETSVAQPPAPKPPRPPSARSNAPPRAAPNARAGADAAAGGSDLARRIEDRRRQMREDAERLRNGGGKPNPTPPNAPPKK